MKLSYVPIEVGRIIKNIGVHKNFKISTKNCDKYYVQHAKLIKFCDT